jgi:hypothetical protein
MKGNMNILAVRNKGILPLLLLGLLVVFPENVAGAAEVIAEAARKVGYTMSGQEKEASAIAGVHFSGDVLHFGNVLEKGFYLSGIAISGYKEESGGNKLEGVTIHQDKLGRKIYSGFSLVMLGDDPTTVTSVRIAPVGSEKPEILFFVVPEGRISLHALQRLSFAEALQLAGAEAQRIDDQTPADPAPLPYVLLAFQMNKETAGNSVKIVMANVPGETGSQLSGLTLNKEGWLIAALQADFACNAGKQYFFNLVQETSAGQDRIVGVYSNQSLGIRIRQALLEKGYQPGPGPAETDQQTAAAVRAYQQDIGLFPDGKACPSLLRLLDSPGLRSAVAMMQENLNNIGYKAGVVDGKMGPRTRQAMQSYQRHMGLEEEEKLSAALLCMLADHAIQTALYAPQAPRKIDRESAPQKFEEKMWPNTVNL